MKDGLTIAIGKMGPPGKLLGKGKADSSDDEDEDYKEPDADDGEAEAMAAFGRASDKGDPAAMAKAMKRFIKICSSGE